MGIKAVKITRLVRMGNSRVVRIPNDWLKQLRVGDTVDISCRGEELVIRPAGYHPRQGWAEAARAMARNGDDALLDEWPPTQWDMTEWEW